MTTQWANGITITLENKMDDDYREKLVAMLCRTSNGTVSAEEIRKMLFEYANDRNEEDGQTI